MSVPAAFTLATNVRVHTDFIAYVLSGERGFVAHRESGQSVEFTLAGEAADDGHMLFRVRDFVAIECPRNACADSIDWPQQVGGFDFVPEGARYRSPPSVLGQTAAMAFALSLSENFTGRTLPVHEQTGGEVPCTKDFWLAEAHDCGLTEPCTVLASHVSCAPAFGELGYDVRFEVDPSFAPVRLVVVETLMTLGETPSLGIRSEIHHFAAF